MVVWSGRGILSFLVFLIVLIVSGLSLPKEFSYYGWVIASFAAAIFSWFMGIKWNNSNYRSLVDENTGQRILLKPNHSLFWIKMQYWGLIFWILGFLFLAYKSILASTISIVILFLYILLIKRKKNDLSNSNSFKDNSANIASEKETIKTSEELLAEEKMKRRQEKEDHNRFMPK